jgi:hypothetical protein
MIHGAIFNTIPGTIPAVRNNKIDHGIHEDGKAFLFFHGKTGFALVEEFIGLGAGRLYRRPARTVKYPVLDEAFINEPSHFPAQSVDFPYKIPFGKPAYSRIAGKSADTVGFLGNEQAGKAKPRNGKGSLYARMSSAYNYTIIIHILLYSRLSRSLSQNAIFDRIWDRLTQLTHVINFSLYLQDLCYDCFCKNEPLVRSVI